MTEQNVRELGETGLVLTELGFGGAGLGELFERLSEHTAQQTLRAAWDVGIRYFDTSPWYGHGLSEHRVGHFLRDKPPSSYVLSTKVGRVYSAPDRTNDFSTAPWAGGLPFALRFDYTREGVIRSFEDSLQRLGLNRSQILTIHDLDVSYHGDENGVTARLAELDSGGGFAALDQLRSEGTIQAIGVGINRLGMIPTFLHRFDVDLFLVAMPYTLLDQGALDEELGACEAAGVGIVIGSPFASGVLATGVTRDAKYNYAELSPDVASRVERIEALCEAHNISLPAAALQFPLAHPSVVSVIPGAISARQVRENAQAFEEEIPAAFWKRLLAEGLVHPEAPLPVGAR